MGVNIHTHFGSTSANQQAADIMRNRNIKSARMDLFYDSDLTLWRDQASRIKAFGGHIEAVTQAQIQWDHSCNQNFAAVESLAYNQTANVVHKVKDIVHDFELLNEVQLRSEIQAEVPWNQAGTTASTYYNKPCVNSLVAGLKGMSRAIRDIRASSGLPLRIIMGVVGRDFAFLDFLLQQGVQFDVVGYHIYPWANHTSLMSDPWFGTGGPLVQLAKFNRPVRINEFHCGEIYGSGFENLAGATNTELCFKSLDKHLTDLKNQKIVNLEAVSIYELVDEPSKAAPENRFGLLYDLNRPKVNLYVVSAFAGGNLTAAEQYEVTRRGLLTDAEIAAYKSSGGGGSTPTTTTTTTSTTTTTTLPRVESSQGATVPPLSRIVDSSLNVFTLVYSGATYENQIAKNGVIDTRTRNVTLLLYYNRMLYQQNIVGNFYRLEADGNWTQVADPRVSTTTSTTTTTTTSSTTSTTVPSGIYYNLTISSPASGATVSGAILVSGTGPLFKNVEVFSSANVLLGRAVPSATGAFSIPVDTTKLANGSQTLKIQGWDSEAGTPYTFTDIEYVSINVQNAVVQPPSDTIAPSVSITSPANGTNFRRGALVNVAASATDNVGVVDVRFYLNGSLKCTDTTAAYQCQIRLPKKRQTHTIEVQARDRAGNIGRQSIQIFGQ